MFRPVRVILRGGLGNQLFGWAAGYALSQKTSRPLELLKFKIVRDDHDILDPRAYELGYFCIEGSDRRPSRISFLLRDRFRNLVGSFAKNHTPFYFREKGFEYDEAFQDLRGPAVLDGYFQSWKYFAPEFASIRSKLLSANLISDSSIDLSQTLSHQPWVGVHVRRSDYLKVGNMALPGREYYSTAIAEARLRAKAQRVVVFSDQISEARSLVPDADDYIGSDKIALPGDVLGLLRRADAFVGANSTLSWWSAFLSKPGAPIFFPKRWFVDPDVSTDDLLLPGWETI